MSRVWKRHAKYPDGLGPVLMTNREVAARLNVTIHGVASLARRGVLQRLSVDGWPFYLRDEVERRHRDGWPYRHWRRVLSHQEHRFRNCEYHRQYQRDWLARQRDKSA